MDPLLDKIIAAIKTHPELQYESAQLFYLSSIQPTVHFTETIVMDNTVPIGVSKTSGQPDLPADTPWPIYNNTPMYFIGQFNCADIFNIHHFSLLPSTGLLSFFVYEHEGRFQLGSDGIKVIYTTSDKALGRKQPPYPEEIWAKCGALTFYKTYSIPEYSSSIRQAVKGWTNLPREIDTILQSFYKDVHPYNHLMGYPREFNGSMMDAFWAIQALQINDWDEVEKRQQDISREMLRFTALLHIDFCCSQTGLSALGGCVTVAFGFYTEELALRNFSRPFLSARN